ncbi:MlaD family protein [Luteolibacter flavescens]|uniref:MlaD family protein n=1 Tax=Luteolibacter flavescens TaxID=1859460 RepID=A0ABT3FLF5_9BACT|nr:MlaD family protein [Luteolibacter flavescens]MCW1883810.1 MlaD family protein [Luteolibacter flavescens]
MGESSRKTELWVGLFVFIGLTLLGALVVQFGRFGDRLHGKYQVMVVFDDASGLIKGSEIRMGGARIGKVEEHPELNSDVKVQVVMSINEAIHIPEKSMIQIASATLLGDKMIVITPPPSRESTGRYIEPGSVVRGGGPSGLDAIQNNAESISRDARILMEDAGVTFKKVDAAVDDIRAVTSRLVATLDKVNDSILSEQNLKSIDGTLANFEKATAELAPTVAEARSAIAAFEKASASAQGTFANADRRIDELKPALEEVPKAVASLSRAADKAGQAIDRAEQGDGLLGTLAYDRDVSDDAKVFIRNLRQQGILRYRDKETPQDDPRNRFRGRRR